MNRTNIRTGGGYPLNNGFTLIELLAVIVILAIIALIAVPIVINIINASKKSAVVRSGELYLDAVETEVTRKNLAEQFNPISCIIQIDGNLICTDESNNKEELKIETTGKAPIEGIIELRDGKIIEVTDMVLNKFELEKEPDERLKIKNELKDATPPEVKVNINKITTNSITITVEAKDNESGIKAYYYSKDKKKYTEGTNVYELEDLKPGTEYTIYVKVINGGRLETEKSVTARTTTIDTPTYQIDKEGWANQKIVTINYPIIEGQELTYEYSTDIGETWNTATQIQEVQFTSNGTLIARVTDGKNKITGNALTINQIDTTLPTITSVTGNGDTWTINKTLVVNAEDSESGIKEYSFDNGTTWQESNEKIITTNGTYNIKVKDNAENISEVTNVVVNKVSTTAPSISIEKTTIGSNYIVVQVKTVDNEMGVSKIEYSKDNGSTWINGNKNTSYTFNGLTKNTSYNIKVKVTSNNTKTGTSTTTVNTKNITVPTYTVNTTAVSTSKIVTITYPTISEQTLTYEYSLDKGSTWKTATQSQKLTFTKNGTVIARVKDGTNTVTASTYTVDNIKTAEAIALNGAEPELYAGLTPVVYSNNAWKVVDPTTKWYDYAKQQWANAVILKSGVSKSVGQTVNVSTEVRAMFVWIPRYEYKISGTYGKGGTSAALPGEIEVNFISKTKTTATSGYRIHPAFTFGTTQLQGLWAGKFETTGTASAPTILPSVKSLVSQNVSTQFATAQKFKTYMTATNIDAHMAKNVDWGAMAYLSQSKYGKYGNSSYTGANKEVMINNCSNLITGVGADSQNAAASTSTCTANTYATAKGQAASTTGNITGIYDMSGGAYEYVMGLYRGSDAYTPWGTSSSSKNSAGFTSAPNAKYYDSLISRISAEACNSGICYGHALSETDGWYGDAGNVAVTKNYTWLERGGYYDSASGTIGKAGIFSSQPLYAYVHATNGAGGACSEISFRSIITAS